MIGAEGTVRLKIQRNQGGGWIGMNDLLKWAGKLTLQAIFWVFILSIKYHGRPVFNYANDTLVQNSMVQTVDESLADLWQRLARATKVAFAKNAPEDAQAL